MMLDFVRKILGQPDFVGPYMRLQNDITTVELFTNNANKRKQFFSSIAIPKKLMYAPNVPQTTFDHEDFCSLFLPKILPRHLLIINEVVSNNTFLVNLCEVIYPYLMSKQTPSIKLVARLAGMSVRTFQRYLRTQGFIYNELLLDLKLATAQFMFVEEKRSVTEVASILGYSVPNHLSRAFKTRYGVTPKQVC